MKNSRSLLRIALAVFTPFLCWGSSAFAQTTPASTNTLEERVAQSKASLKLQLSAAQSQKISQKCADAQSLLKTIADKDKASADKRQQIYTDLSTKLTTNIRTLQNQNADITSLKTAQVQFDTAINRYVSDAATYKTAIDDIVAVKCASDPIGFQSLLVNTRQYRATLASDSTQIKTTAKSALVQALIATSKVLDNTQAGGSQ